MSDFTKDFEDLDLSIHGVRLPQIIIDKEDYKTYSVKEGASNYEFLRQLCLDGFNKLNLKKGTPEHKEYGERVKRELTILNELNFTDYILLVWDVINFCKKNDIPTWLVVGQPPCHLFYI